MNFPHTLRLAAATFVATAGLNFLAIAAVAQDQQERPQPGVAYGMPDGTEKFAAGTLVPYGGYNYVAQGDGTMMLAAQQPQRQGKPLPPARQAAAAPATTTRIIYYPTATVVRTVAPNWSYSSYSSFGGFGGFGPLYGPVVRPFGWGGLAGPGFWGPFGPFGPPGFGPYIGF